MPARSGPCSSPRGADDRRKRLRRRRRAGLRACGLDSARLRRTLPRSRCSCDRGTPTTAMLKSRSDLRIRGVMHQAHSLTCHDLVMRRGTATGHEGHRASVARKTKSAKALLDCSPSPATTGSLASLSEARVQVAVLATSRQLVDSSAVCSGTSARRPAACGDRRLTFGKCSVFAVRCRARRKGPSPTGIDL